MPYKMDFILFSIYPQFEINFSPFYCKLTTVCMSVWRFARKRQTDAENVHSVGHVLIEKAFLM